MSEAPVFGVPPTKRTILAIRQALVLVFHINIRIVQEIGNSFVRSYIQNVIVISRIELEEGNFLITIYVLICTVIPLPVLTMTY